MAGVGGQDTFQLRKCKFLWRGEKYLKEKIKIIFEYIKKKKSNFFLILSIKAWEGG